jgi:hypothetical protein
MFTFLLHPQYTPKSCIGGVLFKNFSAIESLELAEAYESYSVERLKNLSDLAVLRQISIEELSVQLGINHLPRG